jgi:4-hydroxybenzoyl-CoA thioesterase
MPFSTTIVVRFGDLDPAGIAYYPNLVNYLHLALEDCFAGHVGRTYPELIAQGLAFPVVKVEMEYFAPVRYGDHVEIAVSTERIGSSSLTLRYDGAVRGRPPLFCGRTVLVCVRLEGFEPIPIPEWLRTKFAELSAA